MAKRYTQLLIHILPAIFLVFISGQSKGQCPAIPAYNSANTCMADFEVSFTNTSTAPTGQLASYLWDFGDGNTSTATDPVHIFPSAGIYTVYLFAYDTSGCYDSAFQDISAGALPIADFSWDTACANMPMQFMDISTSPGDPVISWFWDFGDGNTSSSQNPLHTYAGGGLMFVSLGVTTQSGCLSTTMQMVSVFFPPVADFEFSSTCWGDTTYFNDLSSLPGPGQLNSWFWDFGNGNTSTAQFPSNYFILPGNYNVSLTVTDTNDCYSSVSKVISVYMPPIADFSANTACEGTPTVFIDQSIPNPDPIVSWAWDFGDGNSSISQDPVHLYAAAGTYYVMLSVIDQNGCGDTYADSVTVNENPVALFSADTVCIGDATSFTDWSSPAAQLLSWDWDFGDAASGGNNFSFLQHPTHAFTAEGSYFVSLTVTDINGCEHTSIQEIWVEPLPIANFSFVNQHCIGDPVSFVDLSLPVGEPIDMWVWSYGDGDYDTIYAPSNPNTMHVYSAPGPKFVTLTVSSLTACEASITKQLNIVPKPAANFTFVGNCENMNTQFSDATTLNGGTSIISWWWDFNDPLSGAANNSTLQNPGHLFSGPGMYNVSLIVWNGNTCTDTIIKIVDVHAAPAVDYYYDPACEGQLTQFYTDGTVVDLSAVVSFLWDFGDGGFSNLQDPVHLFSGSGTYFVSLTITDTALCQNTITKEINVDDPPIAFFDISEPTCSGDSVFFDDLSSTTWGYIQTWVWDFDDGTVLDSIHFPDDPNVYHVYANPGTYGATLSVINSQGCTHSYTRNVVVDGKPIANFHWSANPCQDEEVQFTDNSFANGQGNIITWEWEFDDPLSGINNTSLLQNPLHIFSEGGIFYVRLIVTNFNNCRDTIIKAINVNESPDVAFIWDNPCEDTLTYFTPDPAMNPATIDSWLWDFGDGQYSTESNPAHLYENSGYYDVTLMVLDTGVCTNSHTEEIFVNAQPLSFFDVSEITCQGNPVFFDDLSSVPNSYIVEWHWDFGDGTDTTIYFPDDPDVSHSYGFDGTFLVRLDVVSADSCVDTGTELVVIDPAPISLFNYEGACDGSPTQFYDNSSPGGGLTIVSWNWDFGDPASGVNNVSTLQNPVHLYTDPGMYSVSLTIENVSGCMDSIIQQVNVSDGAPVDFYSQDTCQNLFTQFFLDLAVTDTAAIILYDWDFGDGSLHSNLMNPEHMYDNAGFYTVTLIITDTSGCSNAAIHDVEVRSNPIALFDYEAACANDTTYFMDISYTVNGDLIIGWEWNFGDPASGANNTSSLQHPIHIFSGQSMYDVQLIITTNYGCRDSIMLPVSVSSSPAANFTFNSQACDPGLVYFSDSSVTTQSVIIEWEYYFEPGSYGYIPDPHHVFVNTDTTYMVTLLVTDANGCSDEKTRPVYVPAGFEFEINNIPTCHNEPMGFSATVLQPVGNTIFSYDWDFGEPASGPANSSTLAQPEHTYMSPGYYTVSLTAIDMNGCDRIEYKQIRVFELPTPLFEYETYQCDSTLYFTDQSLGNGADIISWLWDYGDGSTPEMIMIPPGNTSHFYQEEGTYMVSLRVTNANGCVNTDSMLVERGPCINSDFFVINSPACERNDIYFADSSTVDFLIEQWHWDFGDGDDTIYNAKTEVLSHFYRMEGEYEVSLVVSALFNTVVVSDTFTQTVIIRPTPEPEFFCEPVCLGNTSFFYDSTPHPGYYISSWHWSFGTGLQEDTSAYKNPVFDYPYGGIYDVNLKTVNQYGCMDSITQQVIVNHLPTADFEHSLACEKDPIYFTDRSDGFDADVVSWSWNFNDPFHSGDTSNLQNPEYSYDHQGSNTVHLIVVNENGCVDTASYDVTVNRVPRAAFEITNNYDNMQGSILLDDFSEDAEEYLWDFGDGHELWDNYPPVSHIYEEDGEYLLSLVVWNEFGCPDTAFIDYEFMFKTLFIPSALSPTGRDQEVKVFKPKGKNLQEYYIAVFDTWGNMLWESSKLDSRGRPVESWDGTFNGILLPTDVYIWMARGMFKDGTFWEGSDVGSNKGSSGTTSGTVTLVR